MRTATGTKQSEARAATFQGMKPGICRKIAGRRRKAFEERKIPRVCPQGKGVSHLILIFSERNSIACRMPRQVRIEFEGAMYHVMARGDRREAIVEDDEDRKTFETRGYPKTHFWPND
jgi:hypothetical protein